jgi:hypothetical protein
MTLQRDHDVDVTTLRRPTIERGHGCTNYKLQMFYWFLIILQSISDEITIHFMPWTMHSTNASSLYLYTKALYIHLYMQLCCMVRCKNSRDVFCMHSIYAWSNVRHACVQRCRGNWTERSGTDRRPLLCVDIVHMWNILEVFPLYRYRETPRDHVAVQCKQVLNIQTPLYPKVHQLIIIWLWQVRRPTIAPSISAIDFCCYRGTLI